jgi:hypothetical protein
MFEQWFFTTHAYTGENGFFNVAKGFIPAALPLTVKNNFVKKEDEIEIQNYLLVN